MNLLFGQPYSPDPELTVGQLLAVCAMMLVLLIPLLVLAAGCLSAALLVYGVRALQSLIPAQGS